MGRHGKVGASLCAASCAGPAPEGKARSLAAVQAGAGRRRRRGPRLALAPGVEYAPDGRGKLFAVAHIRRRQDVARNQPLDILAHDLDGNDGDNPFATPRSDGRFRVLPDGRRSEASSRPHDIQLGCP